MNQEWFPECWEDFESQFIRFENAYSNGVATPFSFPPILTGRHGDRNGSLRPEAHTIAELFDGPTWALTNNPHLRAERGYDRGFDFFADNINELEGETATADIVRTIKSIGGNISIVRRAYEWTKRKSGIDVIPKTGHAGDITAELESALGTQQGLFWAHFMDPHYPFEPDKVPDKNLQITHSADEIAGMNDRFKEGTASESDLEFLCSMYEEIIRYLDRTLADFFDSLKRDGRWEDTLVVLASDHGEAFGEQGVYNHMWDADPIDPLIRVPLLVKFPDRTGDRMDHVVQNADLFATLASERDWNVEVPTLAKPLTDDSRRIVVSKSNSAVRVTTANGYTIRRRDGTTEANGTVRDRERSILESATIPSIRNVSGDIPAQSSAEMEQLEDRLERLGYK